MWRPRAWPAVSPRPGTTLSTPSGMPAAAASSAIRSVLSEVSSAGLMIRLLPLANAGAAFQAAIISGKFHGRTAPTTPIGSRMMSPSASSPVGATASKTLSSASAYQRKVRTVSGMSTSRQSVIGLPASSASSWASSSRLASSTSANRNRTCFRSVGERFDQTPASKARRAARTAMSMSSMSPAATSASCRPVAGFSVAKRAPDAAGRNVPSMKASVRSVGVATTMGAPSRGVLV